MVQLMGLSSHTNNLESTFLQVCALQWSSHYKELVSGHGYSNNQLTIWKYPSMKRTAELTGHMARVLQLCLSPDGSTVLSAGADETLRLWKCFVPDPAKKTEKPRRDESSVLRHGMLRWLSQSVNALWLDHNLIDTFCCMFMCIYICESLIFFLLIFFIEGQGSSTLPIGWLPRHGRDGSWYLLQNPSNFIILHHISCVYHCCAPIPIFYFLFF